MRNLSIGLVVFATLAFSCTQKQEQREQEVLQVIVEKSQKSLTFMGRSYVGVIEPETSTAVSFTGMAVLQKMTVTEGQPVRKGQLLAVIDETQARNALTSAKAALDQALDARERMRTLHEKNSLPDMKWVEVESKVQQAQASYDLCQKNLQDCSIYAPCSGVVGKKTLGVGETVLPSEPVLTILDIQNVKVRVSIPEKEIASISEHSPCTVSVDAVPGETFMGGRIEKGVTADLLTHTYDIRVCLANPDQKLLPGMVAEVQFKLVDQDGEDNGMLSLPVKAVQMAADKSLFVWVVLEGKAHRQSVETGPTSGNRIAIKSGLQEGSLVVTEGYQKLGEGTPVSYEH